MICDRNASRTIPEHYRPPVRARKFIAPRAFFSSNDRPRTGLSRHMRSNAIARARRRSIGHCTASANVQLRAGNTDSA